MARAGHGHHTTRTPVALVWLTVGVVNVPTLDSALIRGPCLPVVLSTLATGWFPAHEDRRNRASNPAQRTVTRVSVVSGSAVVSPITG